MTCVFEILLNYAPFSQPSELRHVYFSWLILHNGLSLREERSAERSSQKQARQGRLAREQGVSFICLIWNNI